MTNRALLLVVAIMLVGLFSIILINWPLSSVAGQPGSGLTVSSR